MRSLASLKKRRKFGGTRWHVIIADRGIIHARMKGTTYYTGCGIPFDDYAKKTKLPVTCKKCLSKMKRSK